MTLQQFQSRRKAEGSGAQSIPEVAAEAGEARRRRRAMDLREEDAVVIAPPRIDICSEEEWQTAIELLADLLACAFERRADHSKAA